MNEPWDSLESELKRLQPCRPSDRLEQCLQESLNARDEKPEKIIPLFWRSPWLTVAAVAGVMLIVAVMSWQLRWFEPAPTRSLASNGHAGQAVAEGAQVQLRKVNGVNYLLGAQAEGVVYVSDRLPFRKLRYQFLDAAQWRDDKENLTVEVLVPREDVVLIPMQVY